MPALSASIALTDNYPFNGPLMWIPGSHKTVSVIYEVMPGMLAGLLAFGIGKPAGMAPAPRMKP